jgi:predicted secreted protein
MPNSGVIEGTDLLLYIETAPGVWTPVAHATTHSIEPSMETRERLSKDTGKWKQKVAGLLDWKASCEALACYDGNSYHTVYALMIARAKVKLKLAGRDAVDENDNWKEEELGDQFLEGDAFITGLPLTAPNKEDATFSISFDGTGPLEPKTVAAP